MVAEMELGFIHDRQRAGIDAGKAKGIYKGRRAIRQRSYFRAAQGRMGPRRSLSDPLSRLSPPPGATFTCINAWSPPLHLHAPGKKRIISRLASGSARVRARGTASTAAGPSLVHAVKDPLFEDLPAAGVEMDRAGIGHARAASRRACHLGHRCLPRCLGDDVIAVARVDSRSASPWNTMVGTIRPSSLGRTRSAPAHGGEGRRHVPGRAAGEAPNGPRPPRKHRDRWPP